MKDEWENVGAVSEDTMKDKDEGWMEKSYHHSGFPIR
jgi:hypothetical protein